MVGLLLEVVEKIVFRCKPSEDVKGYIFGECEPTAGGVVYELQLGPKCVQISANRSGSVEEL